MTTWGETTNGTLLDAVLGGMPALLAYAAHHEQLPMPTAGEVLELLTDAENELEDHVTDWDLTYDAERAIRLLRSELAAAPAALAA